MSPDLVRILIIVGVALALYYVINYQNVIENQGEVSVITTNPKQVQGRPLPKYKPSQEENQEMKQNRRVLAHESAQQLLSQPKLNSESAQQFQPSVEPNRASQLNIAKQNTNVLAYPQISNNYSPQNTQTFGLSQQKPALIPGLDCFPRDIVTPQDLMPKEDPYNTWSQVNPSTNGHLADKNFLESGHLFGIDTISNTQKNPNLQLRSDPVIAQVPVGPWMQSTFSPDTNRRQFEIGGDF